MNRFLDPRERGYRQRTVRLAALAHSISQRRPALKPVFLGGALAAAALAVALGSRFGPFTPIAEADSLRSTPPTIGGATPPAEPWSADAEPGIVRANVPTFKLVLNSLDGIEEVKGTNGRAEVAPGSYTVMRWTAQAKDAKGRLWEARGGLMPRPLEVRAGRETRVRLGDPIRVVMRGFFALNPVSFRLEFAGTEGELFEGVFVDGETATPPRLHIRDSTGKLVADQQFKAGCKGTCLISWKSPPGARGRFVATAVPNYGPFRTLLVSPLEFTLNGKQATVVPPRFGSVAPDFRLQTTGSEIIQLSLQRGRPVVLAFFCRCGLCHEVAKAIATAPGIAEKAKVLAVFGDQAITDPKEEKAFREDTGFTAPFLIDLSVEAGTLYDSTRCPRVWVIDPKGIVRYRSVSQTTPPSQIVGEVLKALG
jgi:peroxiredoxin